MPSVRNDSSDEDDENDFQGVGIASHRSLHRFMVNLLEEASVLPLHAILVQDNASILMKSASLSARAAHRKRFSLGHQHDHLATREISRWESYPYEVDKPFAILTPKRAKNGCVPQRRAKKRSGLESAGEIKAEIQKKAAESLPSLPRRRSSAMTDDNQKLTMQQELLKLFEDADKADEQAARKHQSASSGGKLDERCDSRRSIPKKPMRRLSEVPPESPSIGVQPPKKSNSASAAVNKRNIQDFLLSSGGSQHSTASTETTLSEIVGRNSDLSSLGSYENNKLTPLPMPLLMESPSLDCTVIMEEDDDNDQDEDGMTPRNRKQHPIQLPLPTAYNNGRRITSRPLSPTRNRPVSIPKMPVRRISEITTDIIGDSLLDDAGSLCSTGSEISAHSQAIAIVVPSTLSSSTEEQNDHLFEPTNEEPLLPPVKNTNHTKTNNNYSIPQKPTRRPSELPNGGDSNTTRTTTATASYPPLRDAYSTESLETALPHLASSGG